MLHAHGENLSSIQLVGHYKHPLIIDINIQDELNNRYNYDKSLLFHWNHREDSTWCLFSLRAALREDHAKENLKNRAISNHINGLSSNFSSDCH